MKRRHFSFSVAALPVVQSLPAHAQKRPEEGTDYLQLDKRVSTEAPQGKIEVVEFFWYSCPHCNAFEPKLEAWIKRAPADVAVRRVPVAFRDDFVPQQRLYYVLEALGKIDELHAKVFQAIHVEKQPLNREDSIAAWLDKHGVPRAKFSELYNSFAVTTKARRATQLQDSFKVQGVPALGIAGRWYTDGSLAGNMDRALQVAEFLIAEARKTRA
ncbi:MAG: thiol:disulfide interchange protein DsbA/DsbL [Betaproteobacteria bacterium]|nr:thiol:disulfide interchange protein DsbA/DsbL [Betaproteobacteria bacterium]